MRYVIAFPQHESDREQLREHLEATAREHGLSAPLKLPARYTSGAVLPCFRCDMHLNVGPRCLAVLQQDRTASLLCPRCAALLVAAEAGARPTNGSDRRTAMTKHVTITPTEETYTVRLTDGREIPLRVWSGRTHNGVEVDLHVFSMTPVDTADASKLEDVLPSFMTRTRERYDMDTE